MFINLKEQIDRFRNWANEYPERRSGEWECDYDNWHLIYESFASFLRSCPVGEWNQEVIRDALYIIARDNEMEMLISDLAQDAERLLVVADAALASSESDARWQIADRLGNVSTHFREAESLLLKFVEDEHEYVRRRAILALARIGSLHVVELAHRIWDRAEEWQEYQRMAVLDALWKVNSPLLKEYLIKANEDGRNFLVAFASKIESQL